MDPNILAVISSRALKELRDVINEKTDSVIMTKEAISGLKQTIEGLQEENRLLYKENELIKQQQGEISGYESNLTQEHILQIEEKWKKRNKELSDENRELKERCTDYENRITSFNIGEIENERNQFHEIVQQLEAEITIIKKEGENSVRDHSRHALELEGSVRTLTNQIEMYKNQINEMQSKGNSSTFINEIIQNSTDQKRQIFDLEIKLGELTNERDSLLEQVRRLQTTSRESKNLNKRIIELTELNNQYVQRNKEYQREVSALKRSVSQMENEKVLEEKKSLELELEVKAKTKEIESCAKTISELQQQILEQDKPRSISVNREEFGELEKYKDGLEQEIEELKQQIIALNNSLSLRNEEFEKQVAEYKEKIKEMRFELSNKNTTIEIKESEVRRIKRQLDELIICSDSVNSQLGDKSRQYDELRSRLEEVEKEHDEVVEKNKSITTEYSNFTNSVCSLLGAGTPNDAITKLNKNLKRMLELNEIAENPARLQAELDEVKARNAILENRYRTIDEQLTHERQKTNAVAKSQSNQALISIQQENSKLINEKKQIEKELDSVNEKLINADAENKRLRLEIETAFRKQQIATNKSERLSFFEFSHSEALRFAQTLSSEVQNLDTSLSNERRIRALDNLSAQLESQYSREEQVSRGWDNLRSVLINDFMCPDPESIKSIIKSRARQTFALIDHKAEEIYLKVHSTSAEIDQIHRNHSLPMPERSVRTRYETTPPNTTKRAFSFIKSPTGTPTPTRVPTQRKERGTAFFNRNRPNLSPRDIMGNPPSARRSFK
jgi:chromosome segregation ATPase